MKSQREFPRLVISPKGTRWVEQGHPWIYEAEVVSGGEDAENGALVDAVSEKGKYLGTGFLSRKSKIRVRLISRNANDRFDAAFWKRRIKYAWDYRKVVMGSDTGCCRVIFGEADGFPGLTVDRFSEILVVQTLSVGMERIKDTLFPLLAEVLREDGQDIRGIFERNDVAIRELEGLEQYKGWYPLPGETHPESPVTEICENGIFYKVDVENGQKTGFFLDQKENRAAIAPFVKGKTVLDCFTHTGSFALHAGHYGAKEVTGVDISAFACEFATENARLNGLENVVHFVEANAFDLLAEQSRAGVKYDVVILDPPAFTKTRSAIEAATRGYKEINLRAMKMVKPGGYLITCSCSQHILPDAFMQIVRDAAHDAHVQLRQVEYRTQGRDHPILPAAPETQYLKCGIFQIFD